MNENIYSRSVWREKAPLELLQNMQDTDMSDAELAYANLRATVQSFASNREVPVVPVPVRDYSYERDPKEWLRRETTTTTLMMDDDDDMMMDTTAILPADRLSLTTPPKRQRRAHTPVMSNESKRSSSSPSSPIQSPPPPYHGTVTTPTMILMTQQQQQQQQSSRSPVAAYRSYYDQFWTFCNAKRRFLERLGLEIMETDLDLHHHRPQQRDQHQEEVSIDVHFLEALAMDPTITKESKVWSLLMQLRHVGLDALWWDNKNDQQLLLRHQQQQDAVEKLAVQVKKTPRQLLKMYKSQQPLEWQRRQAMLTWLENFHAKQLSVHKIRPQKFATPLNDSVLLQQQGLIETDKDYELLRDSLSLLLAGRLDDMAQLARDSGLWWRAAAWTGGEPHGYIPVDNNTNNDRVTKAVGNPRRPLWRRMTWLHSEDLATSNDNRMSSSLNEEGAIAALLSHNVSNGLVNPALRTWEKGLYVILSSVVGRMEDNLLHRHNINRRKVRPPYPGTEFEKREIEHLQATAALADMQEEEMMDILEASSHEEMHCRDNFTKAAAAFVVGTSKVQEYLDQVMEADSADSLSDEELRFSVHLILYLASLSDGTYPVVIEGISTLKTQILLSYLNRLASREDLWFSLVLYASHLPENEMMETLPRLLLYIESPDERKVVVQDLLDCLATNEQGIDILCTVIRLILNERDIVVNTHTPSKLDMRKMHSLLWLCVEDDHFPYALVLANKLLRQFLLADKVAASTLFVEDVLPGKVLGGVSKNNQAAEVVEACTEHESMVLYLEALKAFTEWEQVIEIAEVSPKVVDDSFDTSQWHPTEAAIAAARERQSLLDEKKRVSFGVVVAAEKVRALLFNVLSREGGFLLVDNDDAALLEYKHKEELDFLRRKLLPEAVKKYQYLCSQTAKWMAASLADAAERLSCSAQVALAKISDHSESPTESACAPSYWTTRAVEVVHILATETYSVYTAFSSDQLKATVVELAEAVVEDMTFTMKFARGAPAEIGYRSWSQGS